MILKIAKNLLLLHRFYKNGNKNYLTDFTNNYYKLPNCNTICLVSQRKMSNQTSNASAGIIVIGNEILKGQVQDINIEFITKELFRYGVQVQKISIVGDDVEAISDELKLFSKKFTHVITSGGIGPTHDDVTFEAVAVAFNVELKSHPDLVKFITEYFKTKERTEIALKMAKIPETSVLHYGDDKEKGILSRYPIISVENVTVFPGIPRLLQKAFSLLGRKLYSSGSFSCSEVYLNCDEVSMVPVLNECVKKFSNVAFGSYPQIAHSYYATKITLESTYSENVKEAEQYLKKNIRKDFLVDYVPDTITDPWPHIDALLSQSQNLQSAFQHSMNILEECFKKYNIDEVCVSYNGGKDCLAVLHLTHCFLTRKGIKDKLRAFHVMEKDTFVELNQFVEQSVNRYSLDMTSIPGPMKTALHSLLQQKPNTKAMIMGTRIDDPHGINLSPFSSTDSNWPPVMRVNPILLWDYNTIWQFIRGLYLAYCPLYDKGYTSLGSAGKSQPNPALQSVDSSGRVIYLPAHTLTHIHLERNGREL